MATLISELPLETLARAVQKRDGKRERRQGWLLVGALTAWAVLVAGYHPYAEDGGLYLAGVKRLLDPQLYPKLTAFVTAPTRYTAFAPLVAGLARASGLSHGAGLEWLLLGLHLATVGGTLGGAGAVARRCWPTVEARAGAVGLLACWLGLPVAGTSLAIMDPYLTARSFSTACMVWAIAWSLDATDREDARRDGVRAGIKTAAALTLAGAMHPLMAAYAAVGCACVVCGRMRSGRARGLGWAALVGVTFGVAAVLAAGAPGETIDYVRAALTRSYWFLSEWRWFEWFGIAAPVGILAALARWRGGTGARRDLAGAAAVDGALVTVLALVFARAGMRTHVVAALQPMRGMLLVYLLLALSVGAWLGECVLRRGVARWVAAAILCSVPLWAASRAAAPESDHMELPGIAQGNAWVQAFVWARENTPRDALFALEDDYVHRPGEDAQSFRAIAERSSLGDYSKDGGETAVAPELAQMWSASQAAQAGMAHEDDAARIAKLKPLGVTWVVLETGDATGFLCPYRNARVEVCRLP